MISITELPQTEELIEVKSANANGMIFNVGDIVYSTAYRLHTLKTETIKEATICKLKIKKIEFEPRTNWSVIIRQTDYKQECISKLPSNVFDKDGKSVCTIPAYYFTASVVEQENGTKFLYPLRANSCIISTRNQKRDGV